MRAAEYDVIVIGGGPAGLSAAITLGRALRSIVLFDAGNGRNAASQAVHCFLGNEGIDPKELRRRGTAEAAHYGVEVFHEKVQKVTRIEEAGERHRFEAKTDERCVRGRALLIATGLTDQLPKLPDLDEFYGCSVHHCPFCDGWEHRGQMLGVCGSEHSVSGLALMLKSWSEHVTVYLDGTALDAEQEQLLGKYGVAICKPKISRLLGSSGNLRHLALEDGSMERCDALFLSGLQCQRSELFAALGCRCDSSGIVVCDDKHCTSVPGVFIAGDADGDAQFAIVAAAEGAIAAVTIDRSLRSEDVPVL